MDWFQKKFLEWLNFIKKLSLWGHSKGTLLRRGGRSLKSEQKWTGGGGILACVYVRFSKKIIRFSKWSFISYSPVFLIDYNGSMKY